MLDKIQDNCIICLDTIPDNNIPSDIFFNCLSCNDPKNDHRKLFHTNCFKKYIIYNNKCPICNNKLLINDIENNNIYKLNSKVTLYLLFFSIISLFIITPLLFIIIYG